MRLFFFLSIALLAAGCGASPGPGNENSAANTSKPPAANKAASVVPISGYTVVNSYPHDPRAFTQGLLYHNGFLYESTGQEGESSLRKVEIETGKVVLEHELPDDVFAEGIALLGNEIYQLSWRNRTGWVYSVNDFKLQREFSYSGEGWGLTADGTNLYMSDGTHVIRVVNPQDFKTVRTIVVKDEAGKPLMQLNELEFIKGEIWANIWHSEEIDKPNHIARIDPETGKLLGWLDLSGISPADQNGMEKSEHTLNGIAYDEANDRIFVTGKLWKKLYEIKLVQK